MTKKQKGAPTYILDTPKTVQNKLRKHSKYVKVREFVFGVRSVQYLFDEQDIKNRKSNGESLNLLNWNFYDDFFDKQLLRPLTSRTVRSIKKEIAIRTALMANKVDLVNIKGDNPEPSQQPSALSLLYGELQRRATRKATRITIWISCFALVVAFSGFVYNVQGEEAMMRILNLLSLGIFSD